MTPEQLLRVYARQVDNLNRTDETGLNEELVLLTRDSLADVDRWTPEQEQQIGWLDDQLVAHWRQLAVSLPNPNFVDDRKRWWWFLHEGPGAREQAKIAASARR